MSRNIGDVLTESTEQKDVGTYFWLPSLATLLPGFQSHGCHFSNGTPKKKHSKEPLLAPNRPMAIGRFGTGLLAPLTIEMELMHKACRPAPPISWSGVPPFFSKVGLRPS